MRERPRFLHKCGVEERGTTEPLTRSSSLNTLALLQLELPKTRSDPPPIFTPADRPVDWLLAKCWVRSSDMQLHEIQSHLLRGHLMAEVFSVATRRTLPSVHPVFKVMSYSLLFCLCFSLPKTHSCP